MKMKCMLLTALVLEVGCTRPTDNVPGPIPLNIDSDGQLSCRGAMITESTVLGIIAKRAERLGHFGVTIEITSDSSWAHVDSFIKTLHSAGETNICLVFLDHMTSDQLKSAYP